MNLIERVKNIMLKPHAEWDVIKNENHSVKQLFLNYAVILAAIPSVAVFIGFSSVGVSTGYGNLTLPLSNSLVYAIFNYVFSLAGVYVVAFIMDALAPNFGSTKNMEDSVKVVVFSYTASWLGGIFLLIPSLSNLSAIAGIYSIVLLYMGMRKIKEIPQEKIIPYFLLTLVSVIIILAIISTIVNTIAFGGFSLFQTIN